MKKLLLCIVLLLSLLLTVIPCSAAERTEAENNNTLDHAEEFTVGDIMIAQLSDEKDVDCFKFQVPYDGTILFTFDPVDQSGAVYSYSWMLTVYGPDMTTVLLSRSLPSDKPVRHEIENAEPGMHYLTLERIKGGNPLTNGYSDQRLSIGTQMGCKEHGSLKEWEIIINPTCQDVGEKVQRCSVCNGIVKTEPVDKADHSYTDWTILEEATITKDGKRERTCIYCGEVFAKTYTHPMAYVLAFGFVGFIILMIVVISTVSKKRSKSSSGSSYRSSSYSSGGSGSYNYNSGGSYGGGSYGGGSVPDSNSSFDDPCILGHAYDYNPATNTYTNADGGTMTLEKGFVVADDGSIHIDVSDM